MQPPFQKQTPGERIRESISGEVDPAGPEKDSLEAQMLRALEGFFHGQRVRVQEALEPRIPADRKGIQLPLPFWTEEAKKLLSILLPLLQVGAEGGVGVHQGIVAALGLEIDWTLPFTEAARWAREYGAELVKGITETTRGRVREVVANWIEAPDVTLPDLWNSLMQDPGFARNRAKLIATTETTRAYAEGEMAGARALESEGWFEYIKEWQTANDDRVCPICQPLQGATVNGTKGQFESIAGMLLSPPAHPGCRCWINTVPVVPS